MLAKQTNCTTVKFIHASDIHLGIHQYRSDERANDFIRAFQEILSLALKYQVDFIILGGDVFTSLEMLPGKLTSIIKILQDYHKETKNLIPIISIEGNHDIRKFSRGIRFDNRGQSWLKVFASLGLIVLLDVDLNVPSDEIFKDYDFEKKQGGKLRVKNVMIYGTRYFHEDIESNLSKIRKAIDNNDGLFHILIQHFGIEGQLENVPGVKLDFIYPFQHRVHYLALGHYHKQFIIDNWIYNPGSSEAASYIDFTYKRGIFLVEVEENGSFSKKVTPIILKNRCFIWETITIAKSFSNRDGLYDYIMKGLIEKNPSDLRMPILYLVLKGKKPQKPCTIKEKSLRDSILTRLKVVDVRIYQKFTDTLRSIDNFL